MVKKVFNFKNILLLLAIVLFSVFMPNDMAEVQAGYSIGEPGVACNVDNLNYTFQTIEGTTITSQAQGKPKLLIFFDITCGENSATFSGISQVSDFGNLDIVAIDTEERSKLEIINFRDTYASKADYINFCYSTSGYQLELLYYLNRVDYDSVTFNLPVIVYIDANNKIQYMTGGYSGVDEIINNLNKYCNAELDIEAPSLIKKATNVVSGVRLYWNAVEGADHYMVRRYWDEASAWFPLGITSSTNFLDTSSNLESGRTYTYRVEVYKKVEGNTNVGVGDEEISITYVSTPDLTLRINRAIGIGLGWNQIKGATGYAIYRKPYYGNAAWSRVATITDPNKTTWDDTSVKVNNGTIYRYTVRALAGTDRSVLSGCRSTGRTMVRLTSRTMNSVTKTAATSVKCTWSTTAQASGYEVRFMNGDTIVRQFTVGNYKTGAKTFAGIPAGANYKVQVRSYKKVDGVGAFYSAWSTPKYISL